MTKQEALSLREKMTERLLESEELFQQERIAQGDVALAERVAAFGSRLCGFCGGHEALLDRDGSLVCPCMYWDQEKRQAIIEERVILARKRRLLGTEMGQPQESGRKPPRYLTERPSTTWVPDDYGQLWATCPAAQVKHPAVPPWYTNERYDKQETRWQHEVRLHGLQAICERRQVYLDGFRDCRGTKWCGHCFHRMEFVNLGADLGYPDLHEVYALKETRSVQGEEAWARFAEGAGFVCIDQCVHLLKRRQHTLQMTGTR